MCINVQWLKNLPRRVLLSLKRDQACYLKKGKSAYCVAISSNLKYWSSTTSSNHDRGLPCIDRNAACQRQIADQCAQCCHLPFHGAERRKRRVKGRVMERGIHPRRASCQVRWNSLWRIATAWLCMLKSTLSSSNCACVHDVAAGEHSSICLSMAQKEGKGE